MLIVVHQAFPGCPKSIPDVEPRGLYTNHAGRSGQVIVFGVVARKGIHAVALLIMFAQVLLPVLFMSRIMQERIDPALLLFNEKVSSPSFFPVVACCSIIPCLTCCVLQYSAAQMSRMQTHNCRRCCLRCRRTETGRSAIGCVGGLSGKVSAARKT